MKQDTFIEKVRKNKISSPIQPGFKIKKWDKTWKEIKSQDEKSINIYKAGKIIHCILRDLRKELNILYKKKAPDTTNEKLLEL